MKIRKTLLSFAWAIMVALSFTTQGDAKNKADEIYHSFRIAKDSVHVYSTMLEHYKYVTDLKAQ